MSTQTELTPEVVLRAMLRAYRDAAEAERVSYYRAAVGGTVIVRNPYPNSPRGTVERRAFLYAAELERMVTLGCAPMPVLVEAARLGDLRFPLAVLELERRRRLEAP